MSPGFASSLISLRGLPGGLGKSVGVIVRSEGPPRASTAPSGGSAVREATSVGVTTLSLYLPAASGPR
ncbi:MAG: hypothetical protein C0428_15365 [Polaromonas sp.]|nr:hypothetical protein [Polaromonas sp.]